jgi:hypothetical protein
MSAIESVRNFINALEANEHETATNALTDDFLCIGWTPKPLDKRTFLNVITELKQGIPGLMFNLHNMQEEQNIEQGSMVKGNMQVAGYQSDSINIPSLSLPPIPQMGQSISLPVEDVTFLVSGEQVSRMNIKHVSGGGVAGILHQLGFDAPIIQ